MGKPFILPSIRAVSWVTLGSVFLRIFYKDQDIRSIETKNDNFL